LVWVDSTHDGNFDRVLDKLNEWFAVSTFRVFVSGVAGHDLSIAAILACRSRPAA